MTENNDFIVAKVVSTLPHESRRTEVVNQYVRYSDLTSIATFVPGYKMWSNDETKDDCFRITFRTPDDKHGLLHVCAPTNPKGYQAIQARLKQLEQ
jgi:hypothetical protein